MYIKYWYMLHTEASDKKKNPQGKSRAAGDIFKMKKAQNPEQQELIKEHMA